jgi:hypothetical protein
MQLQHLQSLQLQHCKFTGIDIVRLLSVMHKVTSLTALQLQFNSLAGVSATPLLTLNTSLTHLILPPPPPPPDPSQQLNRVRMLMQHECASQLIDSVSKMCARNRETAAAILAEKARLEEVRAFSESIVMEAIASGMALGVPLPCILLSLHSSSKNSRPIPPPLSPPPVPPTFPQSSLSFMTSATPKTHRMSCRHLMFK